MRLIRKITNTRLLFVPLRTENRSIQPMKQIKVLGPGCPKCKTTYSNVLEAVKQLGIEANVVKVEDIEEMMKYNVLTTPVVMIDDAIKIKGRVAQVSEIVDLLKK